MQNPNSSEWQNSESAQDIESRDEWGMEMLKECFGENGIQEKSWKSNGNKEKRWEGDGEKTEEEGDMPPLDGYSNNDIRQKEEQELGGETLYEIDAETKELMEKQENCPSCSYLMGIYPQMHSEQCEIWGKVGLGWRQSEKYQEEEKLHTFHHWSEEAKGDWEEWTADPPPLLAPSPLGTPDESIKEEEEGNTEREWKSERELRHASKDIVSFLRKEWRGDITFPQVRDRMPWINQTDVERIAEGGGCRYRTKRIEIKWRAGEMWISLTRKRHREEEERWAEEGRHVKWQKEEGNSRMQVKTQEDGEGSSANPMATIVKRIQYRGE